MLARLVSSTASRWAASSASRSAVRRSGRRSATGLEASHEPTKRELVPDRAKAAKQSYRAAREHGVPALGLPREDVRQMELDVGHLRCGEGVADGETRV